MAKNLKLTIKNTQIAQAINLDALKSKLADKKGAVEEEPKKPKTVKTATKATKTKKGEEASHQESPAKEIKEEGPKIRARSRSAFAERPSGEIKSLTVEQFPAEPEVFQAEPSTQDAEDSQSAISPQKTSEQLRREIFSEEIEQQSSKQPSFTTPFQSEIQEEILTKKIHVEKEAVSPLSAPTTGQGVAQAAARPKRVPERPPGIIPDSKRGPAFRDFGPPQPKLGPTGRHINDIIPPKQPAIHEERQPQAKKPVEVVEESARHQKTKTKEADDVLNLEDKKSAKSSKFKEFRDVKPSKRVPQNRFDARDRQGLRDSEEDQHWRKRKAKQVRYQEEDVTIRPTTLTVRIPIAIKDLALEMKLKASQLIAKLFSQGVIVTLNDILEDETTIQLLGHEFGCEIAIDTKEEQRIRITDKTIKEEIKETNPELLTIRAPVVAFMGHVDHGKTSLIDAIRKSNRAAGEAGAITQHIGAFRCTTSVGDIAILDTPGHEAFSAMRARGADVTDIVVLVVAGDEGMRQQTIEALQQTKAANVTIVVAINKCDKSNFNAENVYRQLSEHELLPEVWGGQTITINCSAVTGEGVQQLLEMLAIQAEVLELKANPKARARGTVLESEMHKGMGPIATILVQNGTLNIGDALVFGGHWCRVKTMQDEHRNELKTAGPSTPVEITGLSGLPEAGQEFIVVKNEKEARDISEARMLGMKQFNLLQTKKLSMENLLQQAGEATKKILNIVLRADVQGSLEALKVALQKIHSSKAELNIIFTGVGEISESDVQLAAASKAVILGFHTQIESHADALLKQLGVQSRLHNIIYHAIDDVKELMAGLLDKLAEETDRGKAEVKTIFKSSHHGVIAGCIVTEGSIMRNHSIRLRRDKEIIWKGSIASLKRIKEDVREVVKGLECGILLNNYNDIQEGDVLEAFETTYITQSL